MYLIQENTLNYMTLFRTKNWVESTDDNHVIIFMLTDSLSTISLQILRKCIPYLTAAIIKPYSVKDGNIKLYENDLF